MTPALTYNTTAGAIMRRIRIRLSASQGRALTSLIKSTNDVNLRIRGHAVLLYSQRLGCNKIAQVLCCAPSTAVNAANRYLEGGIEALADGRHDNGHRKVSPRFLKTLKTILKYSPQKFGWRRPNWTRELIAVVMHEKSFPKIALRTLSRLLKSMRTKWKSARPIVKCPWPKEQKEARFQELRDLRETLPKNEVLLFQDEVDILLNPKIGRDWSLLGQQRETVTPGQNKKRYLTGGYDPKRKELIWVDGERKNSDLFIDFLDWLLDYYPSKRKIHLILDNYCIHYSWRTINWLEKYGAKFEFHFLPPHCPSENKIERFWMNLHANVTRNHRCRTIEELMIEVEAWLDSDEKYPKIKKSKA
jgi:transposase